jgi:hypothetical protein
MITNLLFGGRAKEDLSLFDEVIVALLLFSAAAKVYRGLERASGHIAKT